MNCAQPFAMRLPSSATCTSKRKKMPRRRSRKGGEIVELTADQHKAFVSAVSPIYDEARSQFQGELLKLVNL